MKTTIITVDEAIKKNTWTWGHRENDCEFLGEVPGYVCGWDVEVKRGDEISYCSMTCTNDFEEIILPDADYNWNELGVSAENAKWNGWEPTGVIVFRGYFTEHYDPFEREEYIKDASKEVIGLFKKYVVGVA